jgi:hypothetical protein
MEEKHKMAVRIQLRRDTAANWVSTNPVLRAGELGIETDTLQIKIGNGSAWNSITNYANVVPSDLNTTLGDYVLVEDIGASGGVVGLDNDKNAIITGSSIIIEGTANAHETTITVTDPTEDRTITLPNATGTMALTSDITSAINAVSTTDIEEGTNLYFTDDRAQDAVATALAAGTHTNISVSYNDSAGSISLTGAVTYTDENAQDAIGNAVGTGLSYNDSTGAISVDTATIQARVADVSDTEIGYLNGVTSAIQTQLNDKSTASKTETLTNKTLTSPKINEDVAVTATATELNYVDGVTSAIQTQLNDKAPINNPTFTGTVTLPGSPGSANEAATKAYVDNISAGLNFHAAVHAATTADLSATYDNGTKTLTASGAFPQIDGHTINETERVLVKSQTNQVQNGIYTLTDDGDPSGSWVLTRAADADNTPSGEIAYGDFTFVQNGSLNGGQGYIMTTTGTITLGTSNIVYTQFNTGQSVIAGNGLSEPTAGTLAINTSITADLSTAQTLTNKTINANANTITVTSANVSDFNEAAQDAIGTILGTGLSYNDAGPGIGINNAALSDYLLDGVSGSSYGLIGTSAYLDVKNTNGYNKEIELDIAAVKTQLNTDGYITTSSTSTLTNKTLTSPKINEDVAVTATATEINILDGATLSTTELNYVDGVTSSIQTQLDAKVDESLFDTKGDILVASADNTPAKLAVGTNGYLLTANSSATNGVEWAAAPVSLPSQSGENGKYLTTDGTTASWATLVVPIETGTATVSANTATTVDTTALSAFTSIEYMVSLKQGSKIRTSKVVVQTDGTSVDMTEFAITETGGTIAGVVVSAAVSSTNAVLQLTATDATSTNVTVKFSKVKL